MITAELDARLATPFPFLEPTRIYRLQRAAARGNARAQAMLAEHALTGRGGVKRDAVGAIARLKELAEQGEPYALVLLGEARRRGHWFLPQDLDAARTCFRRAAEAGEMEGEARLYVMDFCEAETAATVENLRNMVQRGSARACTALGDALQTGVPDVLGSDVEQAIRLYLEADRRGDALGALLVSRLYSSGCGVEQDPGRAHAWLKRAAEGGNVAALYEISFDFGQQDSVHYDLYECARYLELAAELGHHMALYLRGLAHDLGQGGSRDPAAAADCFRKLADQNFKQESKWWVSALNLIERHTDALRTARRIIRSADDPDDIPYCHFHVGLMSELGAGMPPDAEAAWRSYQRAARLGSIPAQFAQALMMARGEVAVDADLMQSALEIETLKRIEAWRWRYFGEAGIRNLVQGVLALLQADNVRPTTEQLLALWEVLEILSPNDDVDKLLFEIASRGAAEGDLRLITTKAWQLERGMGCVADPVAAAHLNRWAATRGHPAAMSNMGIYYLEGIGLPASRRGFVKWMRRAAEANDRRACFHLGWAYATGHGVRRNRNEALRWYERAIDLGDERAMINAALLLSFGNGIARDYPRALDLLHRARAAGRADGTAQIGYMHLKGWGVSKDAAEAAKWFLRAAEQGQPHAMTNLGDLHWSGRGVLRDRERAWDYMRRAAEQGIKAAHRTLSQWEQKEARRLSSADMAANTDAAPKA